MDIVLRIDLNIFSCMMLLILWLSTVNHMGRMNIQQRLFFYLMVITFTLLCVESLSWLVNGRAGDGCYFMNYLLNTILFVLTPVPTLLWMMYADYQIFASSRRFKTIIYAMSPVIVFITATSLGSPIFQKFFYVDAANIYQRGSWFPIFMVLCLLPHVYVLMLILINRNRLSQQELVSMLSFPVLPLAGAILQSVFYGVTLLWNGVTLGLLIIFVNIQYSLAHTDYLTGVFNRRQADHYIRKKIRGTEQGRGFSAILIDLDDFKNINDRFGHEEGDKCLATLVQLLRRTLRRDDFLARLGGDEFLVVLDIAKREELNRAMERINECIHEYNRFSGKGYRLSLSMGADMYDPKKRHSRSSFIKHLDRLMYTNKSARKASRASILQDVQEYDRRHQESQPSMRREQPGM